MDNMEMEKRREQLRDLKTYIKGVEDEVSMILETLQWDRKKLLQSPALVTCKYDANHKIPRDKTEQHEKACYLKHNGYSEEDQLLPDPLDLESNTLVKLGKEDIEKIIAMASSSNVLFKKGVGCGGAEPLSLERLQSSYSADERRAIYDAVVSAVPACHDLTDLALLSDGSEQSSKVILSRAEILVQLRNMRRRPTKYRGAAKSRNYSDVLRDVIRVQMEHYNDARAETAPQETVENNTKETVTSNDTVDGKAVPPPIQIKTEREHPTERTYKDNNQRDYDKGRSYKPYRYEMGSRDRRDRDYDRRERSDRSRERSHSYHSDHSRKRRHDDQSRERRNFYEESEVRRQVNDSEKEYSSEKRYSKSSRDKDYDSEYKMRDLVDKERSHHRRETSRETSRYDEKRDRNTTSKDKQNRRRDRERSRERRSDYRYEERSREDIYIKQEREDSVTRDETSENAKTEYRSHKSKKRRRDRSHGDDRYYAGHNVEIGQERYERYYDMLSEVIYDPNKEIKLEN